MTIKTSPAAEIARLVADLGSADEIRREAAVARLTIMGPRVLDRLLRLLAGSSEGRVRVAVLRTLEGIGDVKALEPATAALADTDEAVAEAALMVARAHLRARQEATAALALDAVVAVAVNETRPERLRLAALAALRGMPGEVVAPLAARLAGDPSAVVRESLWQPPSGPASAAPADLAEAAAGRLPASPALLRTIMTEEAPDAPLPALRRLVDTLRSREEAEPDPGQREAWRAARAALHQVLAARGSRIALYDLRETLQGAEGPLPVGFLAAVTAVGDESCLEAIAAAWERSDGRQADDWWHEHLREAFRTILRRGRLTRRHATVRRVLSRRPRAAGALLPGSPAAARRPDIRPRPQ